ncbi:TrlF family AAA-like ATPase [Kordiimonas sp.]|uniref:TrlF family AAA-like ATPase n=1 Tax=Kordiimonas sp. TaxID=1970157 RepID=UPI003B518D07
MTDLASATAGAQFVRADLHIHSFGPHGSFDVEDEMMTPEAIVQSAIANNLDIISITDHNEIGNVGRAIEYVQVNSLNILVIPGVELSTPQGHLLVYFAEYKHLRTFFGQLNISEDHKRCKDSLEICLDQAGRHGGFGICAHIELASGFEQTMGRFSPVMSAVFCHPQLLALEISNKETVNRYTDVDDNASRLKLVGDRRVLLGQESDHILPKVMNSDAHMLSKLGENAAGEKRLTRFKVDELSFDAVRIALTQYHSRVRLEDYIPARIPHFVSVKLEGNLLDQQHIHLSKNLTCIIGGRGTGKSTLLETIREASGNSREADVVDSEVWPDKITLTYEDETGGRTTFVQGAFSCAENITDPKEGINQVPIECYGQGATMETIKHSDKDPRALLGFLDDFIEFGLLKSDDRRVRDQLLENQSDNTKLRLSVAQIPEVAKHLKNLRDKQKRLEDDKVGDLVRNHAALVNERAMRNELIEELNKLVKTYKEALSDTSLFDQIAQFDGARIVVGKTEFDAVKSIVKQIAEIVSSQSGQLNEALKVKIAEISAQLEAWKGCEADIRKKLDAKKEELEAEGIPFDIAKINQIVTDISDYERQLRHLERDAETLMQVRLARRDLLAERTRVKKETYRARAIFAREINKNLANAVDGLHVKASFHAGCYSPPFHKEIKELMGWKTSRVSKAEALACAMSPLQFAKLVRKKDLSSLKAITDDVGIPVFDDSEIANILERALENEAYKDFEALEFEDRPKLEVTKEIALEDGGKRHMTKPISKLSLGQQQSILLAILIQSNSDRPLLIDQPEDNLDSEFIYKTIVKNLMQIKETRQVIVVTHNANIAVLGDAELVLPLRSTHERSRIVDRGSIDRREVRDQCCEILEGGERAFKQRQAIYGLQD